MSLNVEFTDTASEIERERAALAKEFRYGLAWGVLFLAWAIAAALLLAALFAPKYVHAQTVRDCTSALMECASLSVEVPGGHRPGDPILLCDDPDAWTRGVCYAAGKGLWVWELDHPEWGPPRVRQTEQP